MSSKTEWGHPGALGLAGFGFTTILLQLHNLDLIPNTLPVAYGFFWGGLAQIIAGVIDGRRGDSFGLTAFVSFGVFWIGLSLAFLLDWLGVRAITDSGLAWTCICWGIFTAYMAVGTFRISIAHAVIFITLVILFGLLAAHFFGHFPVKVAGIEGLICGSAAVYTSAAVILNEMYGRWLLPIGFFRK